MAAPTATTRLNPADKAFRLRAQARKIRQLADVPTQGGAIENGIMRAVAERLEQEAAKLERREAD
jgi:hypothetical protein